MYRLRTGLRISGPVVISLTTAATCVNCSYAWRATIPTSDSAPALDSRTCVTISLPLGLSTLITSRCFKRRAGGVPEPRRTRSICGGPVKRGATRPTSANMTSDFEATGTNSGNSSLKALLIRSAVVPNDDPAYRIQLLSRRMPRTTVFFDPLSNRTAAFTESEGFSWA